MTIRIPENLSEVRLEQYQAYLKLIASKDLNEDYAKLKVVSIFCDLDMATVKKIKLNDIDDIVAQIDSVFKEPTPHLKRFKHKGVEYGFIPNLEDITAGEHIDAEKYLSDFKTFHKAMAVLYRPVITSFNNMYTIEKYNGSDAYSEVMKEVSVEVYLGAYLFFWNLANALIDDMKAYSQTQEIQQAVKKVLQKNGAGTQVYTQLQKGMSLN
jgi:hypothetical protein